MQHLNESRANGTRWSSTESLAPTILLALCFLLGVPGNVLVGVAILKKVRRATLTVKLMLNLAVTDALSLLLVPLWIPALLTDWPYGGALCKLLSYAVYCCMYASVLTVTLMSVLRYVLVLHPHCKVRLHGKALLGTLWLLALLLSCPALHLREVQHVDGRRDRCYPHYNSRAQELTVLILETMLGFVVPGGVLLLSYLCITRRVGRLKLSPGRRLSRLVTWVVSAFFVFWLPYHLANLLHVAALLAAPDGAWLGVVAELGRNVAGALTFLNSCLNPFLYAFASRHLRGSSGFMTRLEKLWSSKQMDVQSQDSRKASVGTLV